MTGVPHSDPQYAMFARNIGQRFAVHLAGGTTVDLELTTLDGDPPATAGQASTFSVLFHGPASEPLAQGTYELAHPAEGTILVFIVPIGRQGESITYEAVFTRLGTPS
ncbi:MAG: hypothetical protein QOJ44_1159 [Acidimicrobiaceae bacterium]|jgi:hypothetical protein|nr:hypothetical protein [Acidimicrobiaceae bacterium]